MVLLYHNFEEDQDIFKKICLNVKYELVYLRICGEQGPLIKQI